MVPEYKRNESEVEFLANYKKLRRELNLYLMRDFGIKKRTYTIKLIEEIYNLSDDDKAVLEAIMQKYGIETAEVDKYSSWLIDRFRTETREIMANIGIQIELANSIYITTQAEYTQRRMYWEAAIGYCNALKDKLHEIISTMQVSVKAYEEISEILQREINLLKGVRKSDNKILLKIPQ